VGVVVGGTAHQAGVFVGSGEVFDGLAKAGLPSSRSFQPFFSLERFQEIRSRFL
jgi:hypothetical protein